MLAKTCISCQKSKVQRHVTALLEHGQLPDRRFQRILVDVVGPLPTSQGKSYLFTIIDRYTRWPEAIPMADATATSCARALMSHHIAQFVCQQTSPLIGGRNLPQICGQPWGNYWGFSYITQLPTTRR